MTYANDIITRLACVIDDPMWAYHCEVNKEFLRSVLNLLLAQAAAAVEQRNALAQISLLEQRNDSPDHVLLAECGKIARAALASQPSAEQPSDVELRIKQAYNEGWEAGKNWKAAQAPRAEQGEAQRLMAMSESEIDAEIRSLGGDPEDYARRGKAAVERALATIRRQRAEQGEAQPVALPPLPRNGDAFPNYEQFTGNDMREYAKLAVAAQQSAPSPMAREQAVRVCPLHEAACQELPADWRCNDCPYARAASSQKASAPAATHASIGKRAYPEGWCVAMAAAEMESAEAGHDPTAPIGLTDAEKASQKASALTDPQIIAIAHKMSWQDPSSIDSCIAFARAILAASEAQS